MAFLTFGEGYHNYHHAFAGDYRNGIRWYHFDPTKWTIWLASKVGLTKNLRALNTLTLRKSLIQKDRKLLIAHLNEEVDEAAQELRAKIEALASHFEANTQELMNKLREIKEASQAQRGKLQAEIKELRRGLKRSWSEWIDLTTATVRQYDIVHAH
jgi:stearoyl-CoA desaturase (delta-9 desaturase)